MTVPHSAAAHSLPWHWVQPWVPAAHLIDAAAAPRCSCAPLHPRPTRSSNNCPHAARLPGSVPFMLTANSTGYECSGQTGLGGERYVQNAM